MAWLKKKKRRQRRTVSNPARRMLLRQLVIGCVLVTLVSLLIWGVWNVTRLPIFTIEQVTATGGITIDTATVEQLVAEELRGTYYRLIPKRFVYLYPRETIITRLLAVPRMKDVEIDRVGQALHITYTEYRPFALWCDAVHSSCTFIDHTGYSFATAPPLQGATYVRYINATTTPTIGVIVITPELIQKTTRFIDTVAATFKFRPIEVWFDDRDIVYRLGGGGEIRTSQTDAVAEILTDLETILTSDKFKHLAPGNFAYIDLRYGNKVFVQEVLPMVATSTATTSTTAIE